MQAQEWAPMAREHTVEGRATSAASADAVWALLADTAGWTAWSGVDEARRTADGAPDPEGVGAHRLFVSGRIRNEEEVVRFEPGKVLGYKVIGGNLPFREYHSEVTLGPAPEGTQITWRSTFRPKWPGTGRLIERRFAPFIRDITERLARAAEAPPAS
jgi:hypothetical protein